MLGWAPYMRWAKTRPPARFDLAGSNLLPVTAAEWTPSREPVPLMDANEDGLPALVDAIAAHAGVARDRVATATGSSGANFLAIAALVRPGDTVLVESPVYDPLPGAARLIGADIHTFARPAAAGFAVDPEAIAAALTPRTRLIVLTNPHNPTGAVIGVDTMRAIAAVAERAGIHVLVDEVYLDTIDGPEAVSAATLSDHVVVTSSLTKAYGLAGLRCGWAIAAEPLASRIREVRDVVDGVGAVPAEALATRAFADLAWLRDRARALIAGNRAIVERFFSARADVDWVAPRGGTVALPKLRHVPETTAFAEGLLRERETAVVPGHFFGMPQHIRVAFGMRTEVLEGGLAALGAALDAAGA